MKLQPNISEEIHAMKHRLPGETFRDAMNRVAEALSDDDEHYHTFRAILLGQRFLPGGRIQAGAGTGRDVTLNNCYVAPDIQDSYTKGENSIMDVAKKAAMTLRLGGGIGYDFSTLRPRGAEIHTLGSTSSGPIAFMEIFDAICRATSAAGHRRGAQMGVLRVDHPDIMEFIHAKTNSDKLTGFNISVGITDEFMEALLEGRPSFALRFNGKEYGHINPQDLWNAIMRSTWDWAEPGVLFIDTINKNNNLYYCETIAASNPCGEIPLPANGCCLLGSFNLTKYVDNQRLFDWDKFRADIAPVVRAMDNVIDRTIYPLREQRDEQKSKRRIGLGVTGVANAIEYMGHPYGSMSFICILQHIMKVLAEEAYAASIKLAHEKGSFPLLDKEKYLQSPYIKRLPTEIQNGIEADGIRNSHLISIAPTGTISLAAGNISSGIEPVFSHAYTRQINTPAGKIEEVIEDYNVRVHGLYGKPSKDVTVAEHLAVLITAQNWCDHAVSKTCNVGDDVSWEDFKDTYVQAWRQGAKGCTTFRASGKRFGILNEAPKVEQGAACSIDPNTGEKSCGD